MPPKLKYWLIIILSIINMFLFLQDHPIAAQKLGIALKGGLSSVLPLAVNQNQEKDSQVDSQEIILEDDGSRSQSLEISLGPGESALSLFIYDSGGNHCCESGEIYDKGNYSGRRNIVQIK